MSKSFVSDVVKGRQDAQGAVIDTVYAKVDAVFAVYRTSERVVVQFADNDNLGSEQRKALAPLTPLRGEINGLINGWRTSKNDGDRAMAVRFDRRVADALVVALQGDVAQAGGLLEAIKDDILKERTSVARTGYFIAASIAAFVVMLVAGLVSSPVINLGDIYKQLWEAVFFGSLGGLLSIALAIRARSVLTDLQWVDNVVDAVLRIIVAAISAVVLLCLIKSGLFTLTIGGVDITKIDNLYIFIVIAVVAGFSERFVGDLLSGAVLKATSAATNPLAGSAPASRTNVPPPSANEQNPRGLAPQTSAAAPAPNGGGDRDEDDADGCSAGTKLAPEQQTADVELPEATGGVQTR